MMLLLFLKNDFKHWITSHQLLVRLMFQDLSIKPCETSETSFTGFTWLDGMAFKDLLEGIYTHLTFKIINQDSFVSADISTLTVNI